MAPVLLGLDFLTAWPHMRDVTMRADDGVGRLADMARIGAQVLRHGFGGVGLMNDFAVKNGLQLADIVAVGLHHPHPSGL